MSDILAGIPSQPINSSGGLKKVYLTEKDNITGAITEGIVTFSVGDISNFKVYGTTKQSSNVVETYTGTVATGQGSVEQVLTLVFHKQDTAKRNEITNMAANELVAIVVDFNGKNLVLGLENGLDLTSSVNGTGTVGGDLNGYTLTLSGMEQFMAGSVADTFFTVA